MTTDVSPLPDWCDVTRAEAFAASMIRIRRFEDRCAELYAAAKIRGFLHLYVGEEAVAVGVDDALADDDAVFGTYREHGHALVRDVPMAGIFAEMFGLADGVSGGRGGSMHLFDVARGFYGGNAIVGGGIPPAIGLALADKLTGRRRVTACFFGEGAMAEGEFHESLNLAALWGLPVLFVCENNRYAMGSALELTESETNLAVKAAAYEVPSWSVDGMDVCAVAEAAHAAVPVARQGTPVFLECRTYRFRAHSMYDPERYRGRAEVDAWRAHDPIDALFARIAATTGDDTATLRSRLEAAADAEIDAAIAQADAGAPEPVGQLTRHVTAEPAPRPQLPVPGDLGDVGSVGPAAPSTAAETVTYREATRAGLRDALAADDRVFLMGEDIGHYGGCFAVTTGLLEEFGPERVRDTPLSESAFVGAGIGAALAGMRPVVEIMTGNFSLLALDQLVHNAATLRHMSNGQCAVPLVVRMATGAGRQVAAQHSHSFEPFYAHVPGWRVLAPATVADARGMLATALTDDDPVIIFEHVNLYNVDAEIDPTVTAVDIDHAALRRRGDDVTVVTYGGSLPKCLDAAQRLASDGIEADVIDLRVLRPLDDATVFASVRRTHRCVVVDESWRTLGIGAEIAARVAESCFWELDAPVGRVGSVEVPVPYARQLEEAALPQVDDVVAAVRTAVDAGAAP